MFSAGLWGLSVLCRSVGTDCFYVGLRGLCFSVVCEDFVFLAGLWGLMVFLCRSVGTECVFL